MKKYIHDFKDGDIVTDIECNEIFYFNNNVDGYKAQNNENAFRPATDEEKKKLIDSGKDCVDLN